MGYIQDTCNPVLKVKSGGNKGIDPPHKNTGNSDVESSQEHSILFS
jgi:hypothetical protein